MLRDGLKLMLAAAGYQVVGEAADGRAALQEIIRCDPDIAVMDITMPLINGIDVLRQLNEQKRRVKVVLLSMHQSETYVREAVRAGAYAYVLKGSGGQALLDALTAVSNGRRYFSSELSEQLHESLSRAADNSDPMDSLSTRERQVLNLVVDGKSSAEIATILNLSVKTVDTYRSRLMQKLGVGDLVGLVKYVMQRAEK